MLGVEIHKTIITVLPEKYKSTLFPAKNIKILYYNHAPLLQDFCSRGRLLYVDLHDKLICS